MARAKHEPLSDVLLLIFHPIASAGEDYERAINLFKAVESLKHEHEGAKQVYSEYTNEGSRKYIESVLIGLIEAGLSKPIDTYWASYYFHSFILKLNGDMLLEGLSYEQGMQKNMTGIRLFCGFFEQMLKP